MNGLNIRDACNSAASPTRSRWWATCISGATSGSSAQSPMARPADQAPGRPVVAAAARSASMSPPIRPSAGRSSSPRAPPSSWWDRLQLTSAWLLPRMGWAPDHFRRSHQPDLVRCLRLLWGWLAHDRVIHLHAHGDTDLWLEFRLLHPARSGCRAAGVAVGRGSGRSGMGDLHLPGWGVRQPWRLRPGAAGRSC